MISIPPPPQAPPRPKDPVRVGGVIEPPKRLVNVNPIYPPIALAARKEGLVILEALISEDGTVREVRVLRPAPLFEEAAITAVRQWRFTPTLLNGERVPIVMTVTVGFTLTSWPGPGLRTPDPDPRTGPWTGDRRRELQFPREGSSCEHVWWR